jgi:hypothetical protein
VQRRGWRAIDEEMQRFVSTATLFRGRHFDRQIITWCVSWYTSLKLSLRDLVTSLMVEARLQLEDGRSKTKQISTVSV